MDANPRHQLARGCGMADWWYLDDGDLLMLPELALPMLRLFDTAGAARGAYRNRDKTEVILYATDVEVKRNAAAWHLEELGRECRLIDPAEGVVTLGVVTGPVEQVVEQLREKADGEHFKAVLKKL